MLTGSVPNYTVEYIRNLQQFGVASCTVKYAGQPCTHCKKRHQAKVTWCATTISEMRLIIPQLQAEAHCQYAKSKLWLRACIAGTHRSLRYLPLCPVALLLRLAPAQRMAHLIVNIVWRLIWPIHKDI